LFVNYKGEKVDVAPTTSEVLFDNNRALLLDAKSYFSQVAQDKRKEEKNC